MTDENLSLLNQSALDAQWRELQNESARTTSHAVLERNGRRMAAIVNELERRRRAAERMADR